MFKKYKPLEAIKPEPATSCSQPTLNQIPEEETMNDLNKENITIAMIADEYAKHLKFNKTAKAILLRFCAK